MAKKYYTVETEINFETLRKQSRIIYFEKKEEKKKKKREEKRSLPDIRAAIAQVLIFYFPISPPVYANAQIKRRKAFAWFLPPPPLPNRGGRRKNKRKRKTGKKKEKKREKRTSCQSTANTWPVENIAVSTCLKIPRVPRDIYSGSVNRGESSELNVSGGTVPRSICTKTRYEMAAIEEMVELPRNMQIAAGFRPRYRFSPDDPTRCLSTRFGHDPVDMPLCDDRSWKFHRKVREREGGGGSIHVVSPLKGPFSRHTSSLLLSNVICRSWFFPAFNATRWLFSIVPFVAD